MTKLPTILVQNLSFTLQEMKDYALDYGKLCTNDTLETSAAIVERGFRYGKNGSEIAYAIRSLNE